MSVNVGVSICVWLLFTVQRAGRQDRLPCSISFCREMKIWASDCFFVLVFGGFLQFLSVEAVCDLTELLFWEKKVFYLFDLYQV